MMTIKEKLVALRTEMKNEKIQAWVIPTNGPHNSEYPAAYWGHREWISGFTGSAGTVIVTDKNAALWTDGRYFQQAESQLQDSGIDLMKQGQPETPSMSEWLGTQLKKGATVGGPAEVIMLSTYENFKNDLGKHDLTFEVGEDLIGRIWNDRPELKPDQVYELDEIYAGATRGDKIKAVRKKMKANDADAYLVTALDEIGWILNLRGTDVDFNPVFYAYLWVEKKKCVLFINPSKVDPALQILLAKQNIEIAHYNKAIKKVKKLSKGLKVLISPDGLNMAIHNRLKSKSLICAASPAQYLKAIKNDTEIGHLKRVMIKDGVALLRAFKWLATTLTTRTVSEFEMGEKLAEFRGQQELYVGESFNPIVGYESNGAIMHYRADEDSCKQIMPHGVLLVDSGGQYLDGTTDITRTFAMSPVSEEQKRQYTLVLKGHIALARIHFPKGTRGIQLDAIARQFLWQENKNFNHGTGHGVGFFMNVHEPPQGFADKLTGRGTTVHEVGMYSSNEPGYYESGSHGIRLENLVICVEAGDGFLRHETITLYPFDINFIDRTIMTDAEVAWLNSYHRKVEAKLTPYLNEDEAQWLAAQCRPIE